jgi:hypothetical protein
MVASEKKRSPVRKITQRASTSWLRLIYPEARKSSLFTLDPCGKIVLAIKEVSKWSHAGRLKETLIEQASRGLVGIPEKEC